MEVSVIGRVKNTRLQFSHCLRPAYEAIINSIQAIEDAGRTDGRINITVLRDPQSSLNLSDDSIHPVYGFTITDNGIGFTPENYRSFTRADSRWKADRGGRGIGRFLWLRAFEHAEIESIYTQNGTTRKRTFEFWLTEEGIKNLQDEEVENGTIQTSVSLIGLRDGYASYMPKRLSTIAQRIVEHTLEYFILGQVPTILVRDEDSDEVFDLAAIYKDLVVRSDIAAFEVKGHQFNIRHFMLNASAGLDHQISFCADKRVVRADGLSASKIPNLVTPLEDSETGDQVIYNGYISGRYLDSHVNQERTGFNSLVDEAGSLEFEGELPWSAVDNAAIESSIGFLQPYTEQVRTAKEDQIREYVTRKAPQYRNLLRHRSEDLNHIPPGLSEERLDRKLYEIQKNHEIELRQRAMELMSNGEEEESEEDDTQAVKAKYEQFLEEWNDLGKANLAKYIVHRKSTLEILSQRLKRREDGKYPLEDAIHDIIFPLRTTSDDISFDKQNLWIIDEKLAYHHYLTSDIPLKKVEVVSAAQRDRPDILIFDHPIAVVGNDRPFSSVVVFEFKRPMRDNYKDEASHNPIQQVYKYVTYLKTEDALDKDGRPVGKLDNIPFYCYIVADLTKTLREQARYADLDETPDGEGYFGYNTSIGTYIEIISFDKLVLDAERRNRILFDKLNLTGPAP